MGDRFLLDLVDVCRSTGWPVEQVDGWEQRARGSGGYTSGRPDHLVVHHTASPPSADGWDDVNYIAFGDDDAPLSNLYLGRDGRIYVIAAGATNCNGSGQDPCGIVADDSMNSAAIAVEAGNDGTGEPWPQAQQDAYIALCKALCAAYGIGVDQIHSHAEWAPSRKIDPAGQSRWAQGAATWDMDTFRADVHAAGTTPVPFPNLEENDVLYVTCDDGVRAPMLVGAGWRRWARTDEEGLVMGNAYGAPTVLDARNYDVLAAMACSPSDGWP